MNSQHLSHASLCDFREDNHVATVFVELINLKMSLTCDKKIKKHIFLVAQFFANWLKFFIAKLQAFEYFLIILKFGNMNYSYLIRNCYPPNRRSKSLIKVILAVSLVTALIYLYEASSSASCDYQRPEGAKGVKLIILGGEENGLGKILSLVIAECNLRFFLYCFSRMAQILANLRLGPDSKWRRFRI